MKIFIKTILLLFGLLSILTADTKEITEPDTLITETKDSLKEKTYRSVINNAFNVGEYLHFSVSYGVITAGYATIEVPNIEKVRGRDCYVLKTTARTTSSFDWMFKVRDWTKSYLDTGRFHSLGFEKHLREGGYKKDIKITYDQHKNKGTYTDKKKTVEIDIPDDVMDPLSAMFYIRTMDIKVGDEILIPATDNKKIYDIKVIVHKREKVEVEAGKFDCFVVEPVMADGGVFKKNGKVKVWLTADEKKMPVKMETKVYIGSIDAELDWYILG